MFGSASQPGAIHQAYTQTPRGLCYNEYWWRSLCIRWARAYPEQLDTLEFMVSFNYTYIECSLFSARHVPGKGSQVIANFKLDGQHWFELEKIELALKDFYAATLPSEGKNTTLADW